MSRVIYGLAAIICVLALTASSHASPFIAYSMKEAERELKASAPPGSELLELGGITKVAGMVYDVDREDLIVIGQATESGERIYLDDLVVALRSRLVAQEWPEVSIEKTFETEDTGMQRVRFEGGITNTRFGYDLLQADIVLKRMALGFVPTDIWGVRSYFAMAVERAQKASGRRDINTRFWFYPMRKSIAARKGVVAIKEFDIGVRAQVIGAGAEGKPVTDLSRVRNEVGDAFAEAVTLNYDDLAAYYSSIARVGTLLELVALAHGVEALPSMPALRFWLHDHDISVIDTPEEYPLLKQVEEMVIAGEDCVLEIDGGVRLEVYLSRLIEDGDITAMRDIVIESRPKGNPLTWIVPLDGWVIPGTSHEEVDNEGAVARSQAVSIAQKDFGMSISERIFPVAGARSPEVLSRSVQSTPIFGERLKFDFTDRLTPQRYSNNVGGVMLQGVAQISGSTGDDTRVDLSTGNFSLIVGGERARLDPETYRKFVTALWAVYYSDEDPGISIDPIAPGVEKHLVRYIGKVINTDLGRVMREADYLMKKWSVGTERADIRGFKNPDDYAADRGVLYYGAWSRFWFVPEDMKFKAGDDMLLFEDGRMTVQTEYLFQDEGMSADPSNEKFAEFLTKNYGKMSQKYPVYEELFEYAKLVSLAKYLKEKGIPLYWFLMANKDLVITEDSPGTVDALAKGSDYFRGIQIEGGVDIYSQGKYVYDKKAVKAINDALSKLPENAYATSTLSYDRKLVRTGAEPFSFEVGKESYTVVPQHSLTSGKDRRGIRYQTDLALRAEGLKLTEQSFDILYDEILYEETMRSLKSGMEAMNLKPPYDDYDEHKLQTLAEKAREKAEEKVARNLKDLKQLIDQNYETEEAFTKALETALGKNYAAKLKSRIMKYAHYRTNLELVRYYNPNQRDGGEFGDGWRLLIPYRITPSGTDKREFLNVIIPEQMAVVNLLTGEEEVLTFSTDQYTIAGYVPEELESSQVVGLFILSDASYRLADKLGNEFWFDQAGYLTNMILSDDHHYQFEYVDGFTESFDNPPYQIQPIGDEQVEFLNVVIPKEMEVVDLLNAVGETLTFSDEGEFAGYKPQDEQESRFEILALMSDASFRLLDKGGNEIAFDPAGGFDGMAPSSKYPMVSAISQGKHRVDFTYSVDPLGTIRIASAQLLEEKGLTEVAHIVHYQYDDEGRLCRVIGPGRLASLD